ncbi:MAG: hypothetical protein JXB39_03775 [Deltaproteobacteria bacterium]|nr:hypothetical protein [Deltaproteobacteria bacterium]
MTLPRPGSLVSRRLALLLAAASALALAALLWASRLDDLAGAFLGRTHVDAYGSQWFYWFVDRQVGRHASFAHTDLFFFPHGKDVYLHTGSNVLDALVAVPFRRLLGPVLGYNVFVVSGLLASGCAFYALARDFTEDRLAAAVGAVLFAFAPYALLELAEGRPTQAILALPVLYVRYLWRTGLRRGVNAPILAGVLLALVGYQYWYYAVFGALLGLGLGAWYLVRPPPGSGGRWALAGRTLLVGGVAVALAAPGAGPLLVAAAQAGTDVPGLLDVDRWTWAHTPPVTVEERWVGLLLWQPFQFAAGTWSHLRATGEDRFVREMHWTPWVLVPLTAAALVRPGRLPRGPLLLLLALCTLVAMGPRVWVGAHALPNPPYIALAKVFSPLQRLWWPGRCYAFVAVLLGLAAVQGLALARRRPRLGAALSLAVVAAWAGHLHQERIVPFPTWDARVPSGYRCLAEGPPGALIELPYAASDAHVYYQTLHGRPILGGMIENNPSFTPPETSALLRDNGWLAELLRITGTTHEVTAWSEADREAIRDLGFRYVILQKDAFTATDGSGSFHAEVARTRQRQVRKALLPLLGEPVFEDVRTAVFAPWGDAVPCDPERVGRNRHAGSVSRPDGRPGT